MNALNVREHKSKGLEEVEALTAQINELLDLRISKAAELHEMGVTYQVLANSMGTSAMSARRWITKHVGERE